MSEKSNKTVVVGMTSSLESIVTAYLLKRNGFNCIGVSIVLVDDVKYDSEDLKVFSGCQVLDLQKIKAICDHLKIPFYAANAVDLFKDKVVEHVVDQRLSGEALFPCILCNRLKIEVLNAKATLLSADYVATGHYVKMIENKQKREFQLGVSGDLEYDQTYFFAGLEQSQLPKLLFPLADMRKSDVDRIAKSIGIEEFVNFEQGKNGPKKQMCFYDNHYLPQFVEKRSPATFRLRGGIIAYEGDSFIAEHSGIHNYYVGQKKIIPATKMVIDPNLEVVKIVPQDKVVYLGNRDVFSYDYCLLEKFSTVFKLDYARPLSLYVKLKHHGALIPCRLFFKNNEMVLLQFRQVYFGLIVPGTFAVLYDRSGAGAILLGGGKIVESGVMRPLDRIKDENEEEDEENVNVTQKDFNFRF